MIYLFWDLPARIVNVPAQFITNFRLCPIHHVYWISHIYIKVKNWMLWHNGQWVWHIKTITVIKLFSMFLWWARTSHLRGKRHGPVDAFGDHSQSSPKVSVRYKFRHKFQIYVCYWLNTGWLRRTACVVKYRLIGYVTVLCICQYFLDAILWPFCTLS